MTEPLGRERQKPRAGHCHKAGGHCRPALRLPRPEDRQRREQRPTRRKREQDRSGNYVFLCARDRAGDERQRDREPASRLPTTIRPRLMDVHDQRPSHGVTAAPNRRRRVTRASEPLVVFIGNCPRSAVTREATSEPVNRPDAGVDSRHPMSSLHERAGEVFLAALSRPAAERDAFLVAACGEDEELLREVGSLLMFHEGGNTSGADPPRR